MSILKECESWRLPKEANDGHKTRYLIFLSYTWSGLETSPILTPFYHCLGPGINFAAKDAGFFKMAAKVELGSCNFLRSNVNYLHQSLQIYGQKDPNVQQYRLVLTDGQSVWILPVNFQSNGKETSCTTTSAQEREPSLVGEFDGFVFGVSCSAFTWGSNGYFISVILKEKVVVLFRQPGKTVVKVVKEYPTVFVPQCCEWHPYHPILAVLCKTSAMLLCFSEELDCIVVPVQTSDRCLTFNITIDQIYGLYRYVPL